MEHWQATCPQMFSDQEDAGMLNKMTFCNIRWAKKSPWVHETRQVNRKLASNYASGHFCCWKSIYIFGYKCLLQAKRNWHLLQTPTELNILYSTLAHFFHIALAYFLSLMHDLNSLLGTQFCWLFCFSFLIFSYSFLLFTVFSVHLPELTAENSDRLSPCACFL